MRIKEKDRLWRKGVVFFQCRACIFKNMNGITVTSIIVPVVCQSLVLFSRNVAVYINFCRLLGSKDSRKQSTLNGEDARASILDPLHQSSSRNARGGSRGDEKGKGRKSLPRFPPSHSHTSRVATFLLFSHRHHIWIVFLPPAPPPPPSHFYCFPTTTTTTTFLLFSLHQHHHCYISIVFPAPPPPPTHFYCFPFTTTTTTTTTTIFLLFFLVVEGKQ